MPSQNNNSPSDQEPFPDNYDNKILFFNQNCWKCGKISHIYYIGHPSVASSDDSFHPNVVAFVRNLKKDDIGKKLLLGDIKERYSQTAQYSYLSFGCFFCDSIFGDFYVFQEVDNWFDPDKISKDLFVVDLSPDIIEILEKDRAKRRQEYFDSHSNEDFEDPDDEFEDSKRAGIMLFGRVIQTNLDQFLDTDNNDD
ncbi:hypothetical protein ES705_26983 [subsurface metagenome]